MKVITEGHKYALANFEDKDYPNGGVQEIQFIQKEANGAGPDMITYENGTTNEEVLRMLIDRMQYLNKQLPSRENSLAITKLEEALLWLHHRTADREKRGVKGTVTP